MTDIIIKLRKGAIAKTLSLRVIFYTMLLLCSIILLYALDSLIIYTNIKYIIYFLIMVFLTLLAQYLVYTISFEKNISLRNFKDVLLEKEIADIKTGEYNHPIKFLFPEFDLFYKLEHGLDNENKDLSELGKIAIEIMDEDKTLQIENEFNEFISLHLDDLLTYDLVIKMKRKGKAIFDDLVEKNSRLEKLRPFTDSAIRYNISSIKDRNILIFDDSIHYSNSAQKIIDLLISIGYRKILFLTVISQENSLTSLKEKYPESKNIKFIQFKVAGAESYLKFYQEYMFGYLDHVTNSLESGQFLIKVKIDKLIDRDEFIALFDEDDNYAYEVERFVGREDGYKISLECPWIYDKRKSPFFKNIKMDMVKVRFFVKINQKNDIYPFGTTDINLSPALIPHEFSLDFCDETKSKENCLLKDDEIRRTYSRDLICINCAIRTLTNSFMDVFMDYFKIKLMEKMKANIIEEKITPPYPQEIYNFDHNF